MAERQSIHRQELERTATNANIDAMHRSFGGGRFGQVCAVVVSLAVVAGGVWVAKLGYAWAGTVLSAIGVTLPAIIGSFTKGKPEESKDPEPEKKRKLKSRK